MLPPPYNDRNLELREGKWWSLGPLNRGCLTSGVSQVPGLLGPLTCLSPLLWTAGASGGTPVKIQLPTPRSFLVFYVVLLALAVQGVQGFSGWESMPLDLMNTCWLDACVMVGCENVSLSESGGVLNPTYSSGSVDSGPDWFPLYPPTPRHHWVILTSYNFIHKCFRVYL